MTEFYIALADFIVFIHLLYVLFAVGGLVFIWLGAALKWKAVRNTSFRISHLVAVGLVAVEAGTNIVCPLTAWEYELRHSAGLMMENNVSFVARLVHLVIFYDLPAWVFTVMHISFGLLVILTYILIPPKFSTERQR